MALNAQISLSLLAHESSSGDLAKTVRVTPASYAALVADGSAAGQAQVTWSDSRTLSGASETLNLASLADTRDGSPATVTLTSVSAYYVKNSGASTLAFAGAPFPAGGQTVKAGGVAVQCDLSAAGMSTATVTVTGTAGGAYDIVLIGRGSVS
jgi:hypothetical protein